jgi:predicted  nucleic acid-binding Zn-ribbon protein
MELNMHLQTLLWLNKQIDDINSKSEVIGELLMNETDRRIIKKLDNKLAQFEKDLENIGRKIEIEKELLADSDE